VNAHEGQLHTVRQPPNKQVLGPSGGSSRQVVVNGSPGGMVPLNS
jgi:hypothetical protein